MLSVDAVLISWGSLHGASKWKFNKTVTSRYGSIPHVHFIQSITSKDFLVEIAKKAIV